MSKGMQLVGIIMLGIVTLVIINLMNDVRSTNELDYYLLQEVTEASMYDAVDYSYYSESGLIKVDRDMFLESFVRRFAESVENNREYEIKIIDFNETPPKVSIEVTAPTVASVKGEVALITNRVSGIIETIYDDYVYARGSYGEDNFDSSPPTITFSDDNNQYSVLLADDHVIYGYKVIKVNDSNKHSASSLCNSITDWDEPVVNGKAWQSSYAFKLSLDGGEGYWIAAMDGSNNCSVRQLTDVAPWITNLSYTKQPSNTSLVATLNDDHGLTKYYIAPYDWEQANIEIGCSSNPNLCKEFKITGKESIQEDGTVNYTYSLNIKLNQQKLEFGKTYRLFVLDNNNHMTKSETVMELKQSHKPSLAYEYDSTDKDTGTLKITFKDTGNDLYGYYHSTIDSEPQKYNSISGSSQTKTISNIKEGKNYIWIRDKQDDITKVTLDIDIEDITVTRSCETGGTLNDDKTLCHYEKNEAQCDKVGYGCSSCYTYGYKNGDCKTEVTTVTCKIEKTCELKNCNCVGTNIWQLFEKNENSSSFEQTCSSQGTYAYCRGIPPQQHSKCGQKDGTGTECNGSGVSNKKTTKECTEYYQVKDETTCKYGCAGYTPKSCDKVSKKTETCPDGYTKTDKACVKITSTAK